MQNSFQNDQKQNDQVYQIDESNLVFKINRFTAQSDFNYSPYISQSPILNHVIVPFDSVQPQNNNEQILLLSNANEDLKLEFFRSTLYLWLLWESMILVIFLFIGIKDYKYCNQIIEFIEFGSIYLSLLLILVIKYKFENNFECLTTITKNNIDQLIFIIVFIIQGYFHVQLITFILCLCVGDRNFRNYNYQLEKEIIEIGVLIHISIFISIGFLLVITLIQQKIDPKQYFIISFIVSLILGVMYQAASLKIELIPVLLIFIIFCLYGTLTVVSGQQITNGKFGLDQRRKYMGALLQYLNLFWLCC